MKKCSMCSEEKSIKDFCRNIKNKDGLNASCKLCKKKYNKIYREKNRNKESIRMKEWRKNNTDKVKMYNSTIKEKTNQHQRNRRKDPLVKLYLSLIKGLNSSLKSKGVKKKYKSETILGCSILEFKLYIENKFEDGMNWKNHTKYGWHLDHIYPKSKAKNEEEVYSLHHYTNFQPLWWKDNLVKYNKII